MTRAWCAAGLLVALALLVGCVPRAPSVADHAAREMRALQRADDRGRATADELSRLGALRYLVLGDRDGEAALLARAAGVAADDPRVLWRQLRADSRDARLEEVLAGAIALLEADPDGPYTELAWRLVWANHAKIEGLGAFLDARRAATLDVVTDAPPASGIDPANPVTSDLLAQLEQERLLTLGDRAAAVAAIQDRGVLTRWTMAGPAGDDPCLEFATLPELDRAQAREVGGAMPFVPLHPARSGGGVYDAWTTVSIPAGGRYLVTASATVSLRVEVDGVPLIEQDRWTTFGDRAQHGAITLAAGDHEFRVRAATGAGRGSFSVMLRALPGQDPATPTQPFLDAVPGGAVEVLRAARADAPLDPEPWTDLVLAAALDGVDFLGREQAAALVYELPDSPEARRRAGLSTMADNALADGAREVLGLDHLRRALELDPELVGVAVLLARQERRRDPDGSRALAEDTAARRPDFVPAHLERLESYLDQGWEREAEAALQDALAAAPGRPDLLDEAVTYHESRGRARLVRPLREQRLAAIGTPLGEARADLLEDLDRLDEAADELAALTALDPLDERLWRERVRLARARGEGGEALALLDRAAATFPGASWPLERRAVLLLAAGDPAGADDALAEALRRDPADLELRKKRWRIADTPGRWLTGLPGAPADPEREVREAIAAFEADPGDTAEYPAVVLLDRREIEVLPGGASVFRMHRAVRLQTRAAVEAFAEISQGEMEIVSARTWRTDGTVVDADPPAEKDSYSLRDLSPGCTVEVQAIAGWGADGGGSDGAYEGPPLSLRSFGEVTLDGELVYLLPADAPVQLRGTGPPPERRELPDGRIALRWSLTDRDPPAPEAMTPTLEELLPWVQVLAYLDLDETLAQERALQRRAIRPDPLVEQLAARLAVPGDDGATVDGTVRFVREAVRPPASAAEEGADAVDILTIGAGNHETAVLALLRAAGVEVDRVFLRPTYLPDLGDAPRVSSDYPFSLLRVVLDGGRETRWLDLSDPYVPLGYLHPLYRGAEVIAVEPPRTPLPPRVPAPSGRLPGLTARVDLEVDAAGDAAGTLTLSWFQQSDGLLREELWSVPEADRLQTFEGWLSQSLPGVEVRSLEGRDLADVEGPVTLVLRVAVPGLLTPAGDGREAAVFFPDLLPPVDGQTPDLAAMVLGGQRRYPLLLWPYHEDLEIRLHGPGVEGRALVGWEPLSIRHPRLQLTRSRAPERRAWVLRRETTVRLGRVAAEDYPALRDLLSAAVVSGRSPLRVE